MWLDVRTEHLALRPWRVILVTLASLAAVFCASERAVDSDAAAEGETTSPVEDYLQFAETDGTQSIPQSVADPGYIVDGLRKLAGALATMSLGSPNLHVALRAAAEHVALNPASTAITSVVRNVLIEAAGAIEAERRTDDDLRSVAESIPPDASLLDQQDALREFFRESAEAMQQLLLKR